MTMKVCTRCKQAKEANTENFRKLLRSVDGFRYECRECTNADNRRRYHENKEKIYAYTKKWRENNRETYNAYISQYQKTGPVGGKAIKVEGAEEVAKQRDQHIEENAEHLRAQRRRYKKKNPKRVKAASKAYYRKNREKILAKQRANYWKNHEEVRAYHRNYYQENAEKLRAYQRDYYHRNKDNTVS